MKCALHTARLISTQLNFTPVTQFTIDLKTNALSTDPHLLKDLTSAHDDCSLSMKGACLGHMQNYCIVIGHVCKHCSFFNCGPPQTASQEKGTHSVFRTEDDTYWTL